MVAKEVQVREGVSVEECRLPERKKEVEEKNEPITTDNIHCIT